MRKYILPLFFLTLSLLFYKYGKNKDPKLHLTIAGYVNLADGIGRQSSELLQALYKKIPVNFLSTREHNYTDVPKEVLKIIHKGAPKFGKIIIYEDFLEYPEFTKSVLEKAPGESIKIAYSMTEYSQVPKVWVKQLNDYFDAVVVPDPFLVDVYRNSGVASPIFVLPLGLNLEEFLQRELKKCPHDPFTFVNLSSCIDRKNLPLLVAAFGKAFGNSNKVCLRINSRSADPICEFKLLKTMEKLQLNNVHYTYGPLSKEEYLKIFSSADCFVSLSKGEGFSIQPREAMALGLPCIVTDNTAQHTICESSLVKKIPSNREEPSWLEQALQPVGTCWNCDLDEAAHALRDVYENYDQFLKNGHAARQWAAQYLFSNLKSYYESLVNPRKIILSDINEIAKDHIKTNSKKLYEKYIKLFPHLSPETSKDKSIELNAASL